jgi:two-component system, chemotaxis family, sensor kinase CheA
VSNADHHSDPFAGAFMADYFAECDEHLTAIRRMLLDAERRDAGFPSAVIEELFRSFHSLKGLSGMVELREAELLAHHLESFLRELRGRERHVPAEAIATLIEGVHTLEHVIAARRDDGPAP